MTPNPFGPGGGMFRFERPILHPALALRPVLASALHACVRQPPMRARPLCPAASTLAGPGAAMPMCFRSPCTREPCCIHACGQGQGVGRACLPQAIPWRDLFHGNDISTKINFVTSVMFPGIRRPYGSRRSAVLPASFPTLRSMSGTLEIS